MKNILDGILLMLFLGALAAVFLLIDALFKKLQVPEKMASAIVWTLVIIGGLAFVLLAGGTIEPFSEDRYRR